MNLVNDIHSRQQKHEQLAKKEARVESNTMPIQRTKYPDKLKYYFHLSDIDIHYTISEADIQERHYNYDRVKNLYIKHMPVEEIAFEVSLSISAIYRIIKRNKELWQKHTQKVT